jgi:hypothetical protein
MLTGTAIVSETSPLRPTAGRPPQDPRSATSVRELLDSLADLSLAAQAAAGRQRPHDA